LTSENEFSIGLQPIEQNICDSRRTEEITGEERAALPYRRILINTRRRSEGKKNPWQPHTTVIIVVVIRIH